MIFCFAMLAGHVIFVPPAPLHPHIYSNCHLCSGLVHDTSDSWSPAMTVGFVRINIVSVLSCSTSKNCRNGRFPKETGWWFYDNEV
ncbi:putative ubiquitin-conjugating enzyme E2, ubiquitin-conjugating enzyme/RWD [Helianthus anomalus]